MASVELESGGFGVLKVLAADDQGVHVRLYAHRFQRRPEPDQLDVLSTVDFVYGHMPVSYEMFSGWEAQLITHHTVHDDELDGYRSWRDDGGGYF